VASIVRAYVLESTQSCRSAGYATAIASSSVAQTMAKQAGSAKIVISFDARRGRIFGPMPKPLA